MQREQDGIEYYNSGSWTDAQATYITVDSDGVRIQEYKHAAALETNSEVESSQEPVHDLEPHDDNEWELANSPT
jgi:hypothetical protein